MMTEEQIQIVKDHVWAAGSRGLRARYWDTPGDGYLKSTIRGHVWDVLEREGVGMLNVDDLKAASKKDWVAWEAYDVPSVAVS